MRFLPKRGLYDSGRVLYLPVDQISPNPSQPRSVFSQEELEELADSIQNLGVLQPLTVRRQEGRWELVAGERRLRAARMAGLTQVPCLSVQADGQSSALLALVENLQRRDLDFWEEATALRTFLDTYHLSQEEVARRIGKSQSAVANKLRLLKLSDETVTLLRECGASERHARALLRLPPEFQTQAARQVAEQSLTVAKTEALVEQLLAGGPPPEAHLYCQGCAPLPQHHHPQPGSDALRRCGRPVQAGGHRGGDPADHTYSPPRPAVTPPISERPAGTDGGASVLVRDVSRETEIKNGKTVEIRLSDWYNVVL